MTCSIRRDVGGIVAETVVVVFLVKAILVIGLGNAVSIFIFQQVRIIADGCWTGIDAAGTQSRNSRRTQASANMVAGTGEETEASSRRGHGGESRLLVF